MEAYLGPKRRGTEGGSSKEGREREKERKREKGAGLVLFFWLPHWPEWMTESIGGRRSLNNTSDQLSVHLLSPHTTTPPHGTTRSKRRRISQREAEGASSSSSSMNTHIVLFFFHTSCCTVHTALLHPPPPDCHNPNLALSSANHSKKNELLHSNVDRSGS